MNNYVPKKLYKSNCQPQINIKGIFCLDNADLRNFFSKSINDTCRSIFFISGLILEPIIRFFIINLAVI